ncbi:hypothetical protein [Streptomyces sp. NRRL F-2664]|uniref:hypothetical protein n=1 Tax=Streptomyces sp. NRRL F-2664 TaxID=1463842 RepID=UPI00131DA6A0|nr:hypothetical protein [Streptomyces sp. NRRL F-2664]
MTTMVIAATGILAAPAAARASEAPTHCVLRSAGGTLTNKCYGNLPDAIRDATSGKVTATSAEAAAMEGTLVKRMESANPQIAGMAFTSSTYSGSSVILIGPHSCRTKGSSWTVNFAPLESQFGARAAWDNRFNSTVGMNTCSSGLAQDANFSGAYRQARMPRNTTEAGAAPFNTYSSIRFGYTPTPEEFISYCNAAGGMACNFTADPDVTYKNGPKVLTARPVNCSDTAQTLTVWAGHTWTNSSSFTFGVTTSYGITGKWPGIDAKLEQAIKTDTTWESSQTTKFEEQVVTNVPGTSSMQVYHSPVIRVISGKAVMRLGDAAAELPWSREEAVPAGAGFSGAWTWVPSTLSPGDCTSQ